MTFHSCFRVTAVCVGALLAGSLAIAADESAPEFRYYSAAPGALAETRARLAAGDPALQPAFEELIADADKALQVEPPSVVHKSKPGASGDLHDYVSQAPYLWPDPSEPDGLPYIPRDGVVNPESRTAASDQGRVELLGDAVGSLALAYHFTGRQAYADHAARCLRVWFLDPATKMNPNFKQGQAVPGRNTGRNIGIIEIGGLVEAIDASSLLAGNPAWSAQDAAALEDWAEAFLDWLMHDPMGMEEAAMKQNHGTMYDVRVVRLALHVGQEHLARRILEEVKERRIAVQIEPDGSQPLELRRTKSFNYSRLNLRGLASLAVLGQWIGVDLWRYETADGRSIRKAIDFMVPYLEDPAKEWPYQQIVPQPRGDLAVILRQAAVAYGSDAYERLATTLPGFNTARFQILYPTAGGTATSGTFVPLFNGRDWTGWTLKLGKGDDALARRVFVIEDGMVHVFGDLPDRYELDTGGNATHGMIYTSRSYRNFIFRFEYKWGTKIANNFAQFQYDAGCYYHVVDDKIWPRGIEYQVRYNHLENRNHTGDFWAPPNTQIRWHGAEDGTYLAAARGGKLQPQRKGEHRALASAPYHGLDGQWNFCEVIVMGDRYAIHKLNGVVVNVATDLIPGEGIIGLQAETAEIYYRNIEIKEFAEPVPIEAFLK